jgi:hypothetical protein
MNEDRDYIKRIKHAAINMAKKRGWSFYEKVQPTEEELKMCKEDGVCDFIDKHRNLVVLLGMTDSEETWGYKSRGGNLLIAPYRITNLASRADDEAEFRKLMFSVFPPLLDNYVGTVGVILEPLLAW